MNSPRLIVSKAHYPIVTFNDAQFVFGADTDRVIEALLKPGTYIARASKASGFRKIAEKTDVIADMIIYKTEAGEAKLCEYALRNIFGKVPKELYVRRLR